MKKLLFSFFGLFYALTAFSADTTLSASEVSPEHPIVKGNALLQAWAVDDNTPHTNNASVNFRLRRAEMKASGSFVPDTRFFVMLDPAKAIRADATDNRVLQDLGLVYTIAPGLELTAGQFKMLTNAEGLQSSTELLLPERSLPARTWGDRREPGVMLGYTVGSYKASVMASNGQGPNADAKRDTKDLSVRVEVTPVKGWVVGAYGLFGEFKYDTKGRWGANTKYNVGNLTVGGEYQMGRDNGVNGLGFAGDVAYLLTEQFQAVYRYELLKANVKASLLSQAHSVGVNYLIYKNNAKVQAAVANLNNMTGGSNGSSSAAANVNGNLVTLAFQMAL